MKKPAELSPVLVELLVVVLFLGLSCSSIIQFIAKARDLSIAAADQSQALLLTEDLLERAKDDPVGDGAFDQAGIRRVAEMHGELALDGVVERINTAGGALYRITVRANKDGGELLRLATAAYIPGEEAKS